MSDDTKRPDMDATKRGPLRTATEDRDLALRIWDVIDEERRTGKGPFAPYPLPTFCSECGHGATDGYEFEMKTSNPLRCGRCLRYLLPVGTRVLP